LAQVTLQPLPIATNTTANSPTPQALTTLGPHTRSRNCANATETTIVITTLNVVSARGTRILEALRAMDDLNTDIAILTEAKITSERHT